MEKEDLQFKIEDYLAGKLSGKALTDFEIELKANPSLAQEVELFRQMDDLLGERDVLEFDSMLTSIMKEESQGNLEEQATETSAKVVSMTPTKTPFRRYLAIAASVLLIAAVSTVIFLNSQVGTTPNDLYATHMTFPSALTTGSEVRGGTADLATEIQQIKDIWKVANTAYQDGADEKALEQLNAIAVADPNFTLINREEYYFKKGLVQLKLKQTQAAINSFDEVKEGEYLPNAEWKKALAYLLIDTAKAKVLLKEIATSSSLDAPTAKIILEELAK